MGNVSNRVAIIKNGHPDANLGSACRRSACRALYGGESCRYNKSFEEPRSLRYRNVEFKGMQPASEERHDREETDKTIHRAAIRL